MNNEQEDPLLDACLEELLSGNRPPDLTARILESWKSQASTPATVLEPVLPPTIAVREPGSVRRRKRESAWMRAAIAAGLLTAGWAIGLTVLRMASQQDPTVPLAARSSPQSPATQPEAESGSQHTAPREQAPEPEQPRQRDMPFDGDIEIPLEPPPPRPEIQRLSETDIVGLIDRALSTAWSSSNVTPVDPAAADVWCKRVYQRLLGREPNPLELHRFLADVSGDRRSHLVVRLANRSRDEFARHWSLLWTAGLLGRSDLPAVNRTGLDQYLHGALRAGRGFDEIAVALLTASGAGHPGGETYNGAANFLLAHYDSKAIAATAHTARVFLGASHACAQCHDHPQDEALTQRQFWQLNSFFRQLTRTGTAGRAEISDVDFLGDGGGDGSNAVVYYETPRGELKAVLPAFTGHGPMSGSGLIAEVNRRQLLADALVGSTQFREAIVNRCWQEMFSVGLTSSTHGQDQNTAAPHAELLSLLGEQFEAHEHDLAALVRWLALSEAFGLSDDATGGSLADTPEFGNPPLFAHFYERPPRQAATAYDSLVAMARSKRGPNGDFATSAQIGRVLPEALPADQEPRGDGGELPLTPDLAIRRALHQGPGGAVQRILESELSPAQKVQHLFWRLLSRNPNENERILIEGLWTNRKQAEVLDEIWWALVNSGEAVP